MVGLSSEPLNNKPDSSENPTSSNTLNSNCLTPLLLKAPSLLNRILSLNLVEQIGKIFNDPEQNSQNLEGFLRDNLTPNGVNKWSQVINAFVSLIQECHAEQKRRDGGSYFAGHLVPVATIAVEVVKELLKKYQLDQDVKDYVISLVLLAAIAHDFLEDTGNTPQRLAITLRRFQADQANSPNSSDDPLTDEFLNSLITIITLVTKRPKVDYPQSETSQDTAFLVAGLILTMAQPPHSQDNPFEELISLIPALIKLADNYQNCLSDLKQESINLSYVEKRAPYYLALAKQIQGKLSNSSLPILYEKLIELMFFLSNKDYEQWKKEDLVQSSTADLLELVDRRQRDPARFSIWERYKSIFESLSIFKGLIETDPQFPTTLQYIKSQLLGSLIEKVIDKQVADLPSSLTPEDFKSKIKENSDKLQSFLINDSRFYQKLISLVALLLAEGDKNVVAQLHDWINNSVAPLAKFTDLLIFFGKSVDFSVSDLSPYIVVPQQYDCQLQNEQTLLAKTELLEQLCTAQLGSKQEWMSSFTTRSLNAGSIIFEGPIGALQMVILNYTGGVDGKNQARLNANIFIPPYVIKSFKEILIEIIKLRERTLLSTAQQLIQGLISDQSKNQTITYSAFGSDKQTLANLTMGKLEVTEEVAAWELTAAVTFWKVTSENSPYPDLKVICRQQSSLTIPEYLAKQVSGEQLGTLGIGVKLPVDLPQITVAGNKEPLEIEKILSENHFMILGKAPIDPLRPDSGVVFFVLAPSNELIQIVTVSDYHDNPLVLPSSFDTKRANATQPRGLAKLLRELFDPNCPYLTKGAVLSLGQSGEEIKVPTPWFRLFVWLNSLLNS